MFAISNNTPMPAGYEAKQSGAVTEANIYGLDRKKASLLN